MRQPKVPRSILLWVLTPTECEQRPSVATLGSKRTFAPPYATRQFMSVGWRMFVPVESASWGPRPPLHVFFKTAEGVQFLLQDRRSHSRDHHFCPFVSSLIRSINLFAALLKVCLASFRLHSPKSVLGASRAIVVLSSCYRYLHVFLEEFICLIIIQKVIKKQKKGWWQWQPRAAFRMLYMPRSAWRIWLQLKLSFSSHLFSNQDPHSLLAAGCCLNWRDKFKIGCIQSLSALIALRLWIAPLSYWGPACRQIG